MIPSENCYALIRAAEGLRLKAYRCPAGVWTIGYGHTGDVLPGTSITEAEAAKLLAGDAEKAAQALVDLDLTQNQFDALVSFVFNIGAHNFRKSTMFRMLVEGNPNVSAEFARWVYANGRPLPGLVVRRLDECDLFERL